MIFASLQRCWISRSAGSSLLRPQRFVGIYILTPFGPTHWEGSSNASGTLVHLFDELYIGVYRDSELIHSFPQPLVESTT